MFHIPGSLIKLLSASKQSALFSVSLEDLNIDTNCLSKHTLAAPLIPVSGRMVSMYTSQVADRKHAENKSADLLFRPSAKASNSNPNS